MPILGWLFPSVAVEFASGGAIVVGLVELEKACSFIEVELNLSSVYQENLVIIKDQCQDLTGPLHKWRNGTC